MSKPIQTAEELDAVLHWRGKHAQAIRERDALQALLTAADERNDTATSLIRRIVANFDAEIECHEDVEPADQEHDQVLSEMREFLDGIKTAVRPQSKPVTWTEFDVLDFMSVALRHAEYSGLAPSDILDGLRYMAEKGKPALIHTEQPAPVAVGLPVDPERERLMEIVQQYPNVNPLEYDAAVRTLRK